MGWDEKLNRYGDRIYYDDAVGVAGTGWPIGTAEHPSNNLADIITICTRENIHTIIVHGTLTLDADMEYYDFVGRGNTSWDVVNCAGFSVDYSAFHGLYVTGGVGDAYYYQCMVEASRGFCFNCIIFSGTLTGGLFLYSCTAWGPAISIIIDSGTFYCYDFEGDITLTGMGAGSLVHFSGKNSCRITVEATCTLGDIYLYGDYILTNDSAGTVVYDLGTRSMIASYARVPVTSASANLKNSNDTERWTNALAYTKIKEIIIGAALAGVRITFELKTSGGGATATARIYKNGSAVGAVQTDVTGGYVTKTEDLTGFAAGDRIQIYAKTSDAAQAASVQNFRLLYDITDTLVAVSNDP